MNVPHSRVRTRSSGKLPPASFAELPLRAALSATKNLGQTTFQLAAAVAIDEVEFKVKEMAKTLGHICLWLFNEFGPVWVSFDPPI